MIPGPPTDLPGPQGHPGSTDADGCPEDVIIDQSRHASVRQVYFARDSATSTPQVDQAIAFVAGELRGAWAETVACIGQASDTEADPEALSEQRARMVCDALRERGAAREVEVHGLGAGGPFRSRDPEQQRVVVVIQLSARLRDQWYAPLYVFGRWQDDHVEPVDRLVETEPSGPPRCPDPSFIQGTGRPDPAHAGP